MVMFPDLKTRPRTDGRRDDSACAVVNRHNETSEGYWPIGFLGKEVGYEISTCQMQYDAADKKTDQEDPCFIYLGGN